MLPHHTVSIQFLRQLAYSTAYLLSAFLIVLDEEFNPTCVHKQLMHHGLVKTHRIAAMQQALYKTFFWGFGISLLLVSGAAKA